MSAYNIIRSIYNQTIREHLPVKDRQLAGVSVNDTPMLDLTADKPDYKEGLITAIHDHVDQDNTVEIVGFGRGVSTVHILRAGAESVIAHEAAEEMIQKGLTTVQNNVNRIDAVTVKQSLVGDPIDVYGDFETADIVPPSSLTNADVLVLDCEGAEIAILEELGTWPDTIICETHARKGAPTDAVLGLIKEEYNVSVRDYLPAGDTNKDVVVAKK